MADPAKDTLYIDIDDEITSIIEKVQNSQQKIVALVLPKRATVMQSAVNMKLLKRTADESGKKLVLITSEASLMPLAGAIGVHVAKTLQSKPEIPPPPSTADTPETLIDQGPSEDEPDVDSSKTVGELAGTAALTAAAVSKEETIDVDNTPKEAASSSKTAKSKKKNKIPDFKKFRTKIIIGAGALAALILFWIFGTMVWPKAAFTIVTDSSTINASVTFTADTAAKEVNLEKTIIPAKTEEAEKTNSVTVPATGKKNVGDKAKGTMAITNCIDDGEEHTVPAGTSFTSGPYTFVTTEAVTLDPSLYSGGNCVSADFGLSKDAPVSASEGGSQNNVGARSYNSSISGISGEGSKMTGGTDKQVTVVSQEDINKAQEQLKEQGDEEAKEELKTALQEKKLVAIPETMAGGKQSVSSSPNVGEESSNVTVSGTTTFSMLGVNEEDLKKLVEDSVKDQYDKQKQTILDYGFNKASYEVESKRSPANQTVAMDTTLVLGAQIDQEAIKQEIAGKKSGEARNIILARPGVKDVRADYSPFWVTKAPKPSKITITFEAADNGSNNGQ